MDLRLEHVTKSFGAQGSAVEALRGVSLDVSSAALVALMGASGSGKSTLLHLVGGLDSPTSGSIWVGEVDVAGLRGRRLVQHRRRVGFVFQAFNLIPGLTAGSDSLSWPHHDGLGWLHLVGVSGGVTV